MNLLDLREPNGPFWVAYQEERARERIVDNPGFVPDWFLIRMMKRRLAAARIALEQVSTKEPTPYYEMKRAWEALNTLESFLDYGSQVDPLGARQQVLAGLLGAQEIETAREREWAAGTPALEQCYTACGTASGSAPERCAEPRGHEGPCAP
jgi:hypothetical protein